MRIPHHIKRNAASSRPLRWLFVAVETNYRDDRAGYRVHTPRLIASRYWQRSASRVPEKLIVELHDAPNDLWTCMESRVSKGKRLVVIAHGMTRTLALLGGPAALEARGWAVEVAVMAPKVCIVRARRDDRSVLFLDVQNYVTDSLDAAAVLVGLKRMEFADASAPDAVFAAHAAGDCHILHAVMDRYIGVCATLDLGNFANTLAAQSMHGWRHRWITTPVLVHPFDDVLAFERLSYVGARVEAYRIGECPPGQYALVDINSAYGAVMRTELLPVRFARSLSSTSLRALPVILAEQNAIARVELVTDEPVYPVRHEGGLIFPVGRFWTTLCTPELAHALALGRIATIGRVQVYDRALLFDGLIDSWYGARVAARKSGLEFEARLAKALIVSLYGRFAMRYQRWIDTGSEPGVPDDYWTVQDANTRELVQTRRVGGVVAEQDKLVEGNDSFPAISAHIASAARLLLWRYMVRAGRENVMYAHTDGMIVNGAGLVSLRDDMDDDKIGWLKTKWGDPHVTIGGGGTYRYGGAVVQRGRSKSATDDGTFGFSQRENVGTAATARLGHIGRALSHIVSKSAPRQYRGGVVQDDGRVEPHILGGGGAAGSRSTASSG